MSDTTAAVGFHCDACNQKVTWRPSEKPFDTPFSVEGMPGIFWAGCYGRFEDDRFIPEAAACPRCGVLVLRSDIFELVTLLGWAPPKPVTLLRTAPC